MGSRALAVLATLLIAACDARIAPPAPPAVAAPDTRYQLDAARKRVWSLSVDGVFVLDLASGTRTTIPLPEWVWAGEPYGCLPDLALGPNGEAVITSDVVPTLWVVHPETLLVSVRRIALDADFDKDVGFTGLAYSAEQRAYFAVSHAWGTLWRIDPGFTRGQKIAFADSMKGACGLALADLDFVPDRRTALLRRR